MRHTSWLQRFHFPRTICERIERDVGEAYYSRSGTTTMRSQEAIQTTRVWERAPQFWCATLVVQRSAAHVPGETELDKTLSKEACRWLDRMGYCFIAGDGRL